MRAWYARQTPRQRRLVKIIGATVGGALVISAAREGAFGRELDLAYFSADRKWSMSSNSGTSGTTLGDGPALAFSGRDVDCHWSCSGDAKMCEGFMAALACKGAGGEAVYLVGSVSFPSAPFCYTPLLKTAVTSYSVSVTANLKTAAGNKSGLQTASGTVDQTVKGFISCARFKREIGREAAFAVGNEVNKFLQAN